MKKFKFNKDILSRALKTFTQAFLGSITINNFLVASDISTFKTILYSTLIGALSAGLSAVWNLLLSYLED